MKRPIINALSVVARARFLFGWILKGPIENHDFLVEMSVEFSEDVHVDFFTAFEIYDYEQKIYYGDSDFLWMDIQNKEYRRPRIQKLDSSGKYDMRLFFKSDTDFRIFSKDGVLHTASEQSRRYHVIEVGSRYYSESITVHPLLEVILLIFAFVSGIVAFFEVLSFFFKP